MVTPAIFRSDFQHSFHVCYEFYIVFLLLNQAIGFYLNVTWLEAVRDICDFLSKNSGEFVAMRFKKEREDGIHTKPFLRVLLEDMERYNPRFFRPWMSSSAGIKGTQPSLKQARGKIVLYYDRISVPSDKRINIGYPWDSQNIQDLYAMDSTKDYSKVIPGSLNPDTCADYSLLPITNCIRSNGQRFRRASRRQYSGQERIRRRTISISSAVRHGMEIMNVAKQCGLIVYIYSHPPYFLLKRLCVSEE